MAASRYIRNRYFPGLVESCGDDSNRRFYAMFAGLNAAQVRERNDHAYGAVTAHAEISDIVKEDDACGARAIHGIAQKSAHDHVRTAWLVDDRGAKAVILRAKAFPAFGHRALSQIRTAGNDQPGGFATGVRVDDPDALCEVRIRKRFLPGVGVVTKHAQSSLRSEEHTSEL